VEVALVQGKHLSVDGSFVEANAAKESRIPHEQLAEAAQVNHTVRQYLMDLEEQNPTWNSGGPCIGSRVPRFRREQLHHWFPAPLET
jgi:hypothetical protein